MSNTLIRIAADSADLLEASQSSSPFALLPAGWYEATIRDADVVDFGKDPKWDGYKALNVQVRIMDGSPVGAGRVFFLRVPLFQRFLPTAKNPQGAVASMYFDFFLALGFSKEDVAGGKVALDKQTLGGKRLGARLVEKAADNYNPDRFNEVSNVRAPQALAGVAEAGASAVASAFTPEAQGSPWGATPAAAPAAPVAEPQADSALQAAAEAKGAF